MDRIISGASKWWWEAVCSCQARDWEVMRTISLHFCFVPSEKAVLSQGGADCSRVMCYQAKLNTVLRLPLAAHCRSASNTRPSRFSQALAVTLPFFTTHFCNDPGGGRVRAAQGWCVHQLRPWPAPGQATRPNIEGWRPPGLPAAHRQALGWHWAFLILVCLAGLASSAGWVSGGWTDCPLLSLVYASFHLQSSFRKPNGFVWLRMV